MPCFYTNIRYCLPSICYLLSTVPNALHFSHLVTFPLTKWGDFHHPPFTGREAEAGSSCQVTQQVRYLNPRLPDPQFWLFPQPTRCVHGPSGRVDSHVSCPPWLPIRGPQAATEPSQESKLTYSLLWKCLFSQNQL